MTHKTILVIDDSPTVRRLAERVLSQEGYHVLTAGDGNDGLRIAHHEDPSLIIVDFIMPKMNGYQFCKNVRSDDALNDIPIVLITTKGKDVGKGFAEKLGIVHYLQKPFEAETLISTVKNVLAVAEETPDALVETVADTPESVTVPVGAGTEPPEQSDEPLLDNPFVEITSEEIMHVSGQAGHSGDGSEVNISGDDSPSTEDFSFSPPALQDAETPVEEPHFLPNIPFVEITSAEIMQAEYHTAGTCSPDVPAANMPDDKTLSNEDASVTHETAQDDKVSSNEDAPVEHETTEDDKTSSDEDALVKHETMQDDKTLSNEDAPVEDETTADEGSCPAVPLSLQSEHAVPVYAALQESVEKEFRHYFGRELTVLLKNTMVQVLKETEVVRSSRRIFSGDLMHVSGADVLRFISMAGLSGKLTLLTDVFNSEIYLDGGRVVFGSISMSDYRTSLEALILNDTKFRHSDMVSVFSEARGNSLKAGSILIERGLISEDDLTDCYRRLSEDAVARTFTANSGHFFLEDMPLPVELQNMKLRISIEGRGER